MPENPLPKDPVPVIGSLHFVIPPEAGICQTCHLLVMGSKLKVPAEGQSVSVKLTRTHAEHILIEQA